MYLLVPFLFHLPRAHLVASLCAALHALHMTQTLNMLTAQTVKHNRAFRSQQLAPEKTESSQCTATTFKSGQRYVRKRCDVVSVAPSSSRCWLLFPPCEYLCFDVDVDVTVASTPAVAFFFVDVVPGKLPRITHRHTDTRTPLDPVRGCVACNYCIRCNGNACTRCDRMCEVNT